MSFCVTLDGYNIFNTAVFPPKVMVYFEKHKIFEIVYEIIKLIIKNHPPPNETEKFIAINLLKISKLYAQKRTLVVTPPCFDQNHLVETYSSLLNSPIIEYTGEKIKSNEILERLNKFLKSYDLEDKNILIFRTPKTREEVYQLNNDFKPNLLLELYSDQESLNFNIHDFRNSIKKIHRKINTNQCTETIAYRIDNAHRHIDLTPKLNNGRWLPRVVIIGRRGSGRKVQAITLAREFNLIIIDVEYLLLKSIKSKTPIGKSIKNTRENNYTPEIIASMLLERLLEPDCLNNGWVIVGYPNTICDLKLILSSEFIVPPNKIIFLHTLERHCLRRLSKRQCSYDETGTHPRDLPQYIFDENDFYNEKIRDMVEFCKGRKETIHINGNHRVRTVRTAIWGRMVED